MTSDEEALTGLILKDETDFGDLRQNLVSDNESTYIVESKLIKGVSPRRHENDCNYDYVIMDELDHDGMRFYLHKYYTGHMHYYMQLKFQKEVNRIRELNEALKDKMPEPAREKVIEKM